MKRFVKRLLIGFIAVFAILILFFTLFLIDPQIGKRSFAGHLGYLSAEIKLTFTNNSTLKINYNGVLDTDGNIAASGTSIPITAYTLEGDYDFGVIGTLSNGTLSIVIPPVPKDSLVELEKGIMWDRLGLIDVELLDDDNGNWISLWYFDKRTVIDGMRFVKGWNFMCLQNDNYIRFINLQKVYERGFKWVYYD